MDGSRAASARRRRGATRRCLAIAVLLAALAHADRADAATVTRSVVIDATPGAVWAAVRDTAAIDVRLLPGLVASSVEMDGVRTLRFADGRTTREAILSIDDASQNLEFAAVGKEPAYRISTMHVAPDGSGARLSWTSTVRPDDLAPPSAVFIEHALQVAKTHLERR